MLSFVCSSKLQALLRFSNDLHYKKHWINIYIVYPQGFQSDDAYALGVWQNRRIPRISLVISFASGSFCLSVCQPICLPLCLTTCMPVSVYDCLCVCLSPHLSFCLSLFLCPCLSMGQSLCLSLCLFVSVSKYVPVSVSLAVSLSVSLSVSVSVSVKLYRIRSHYFSLLWYERSSQIESQSSSH